LLARLGGSAVFVDHADEDAVASDGSVEGDCGGRVVVGWVLVQALVRAVGVEVALVLV
jgi:hypothetical protein